MKLTIEPAWLERENGTWVLVCGELTLGCVRPALDRSRRPVVVKYEAREFISNKLLFTESAGRRFFDDCENAKTTLEAEVPELLKAARME